MSDGLLFLGCAGVGKTLLIRQIKSLCESGVFSPDLETTSTAGVEPDEITARRRDGPPIGAFTLREVGSPMLPMWPSYFAACRAVVYVIDTSQPCAISPSLIELLDVLAHPHLAGKPLLLLLNKCDVPHRLSRAALDVLMRLGDLVDSQASKRLVCVCETSAVTGAGLREVLEWCLPGAGAVVPPS